MGSKCISFGVVLEGKVLYRNEHAAALRLERKGHQNRCCLCDNGEKQEAKLRQRSCNTKVCLLQMPTVKTFSFHTGTSSQRGLGPGSVPTLV